MPSSRIAISRDAFLRLPVVFISVVAFAPRAEHCRRLARDDTRSGCPEVNWTCENKSEVPMSDNYRFRVCCLAVIGIQIPSDGTLTILSSIYQLSPESHSMTQPSGALRW